MICLDTVTLIFGIQKKYLPAYQREAEAAQHYLDNLPAGEVIMIPPAVIFEFIQGYEDKADRDAIYNALAEDFFIPAFDAKSARIAAEIVATAGGVRSISDLTGIRKPDVKLDIQIIATAIAHSAETIITFNHKEYEKILRASGYDKKVKAKWLAYVAQPTLFSKSINAEEEARPN